MIMPRFYYQRGKTSDRDWIEDKLLHIPVDERQEVADEYERKYMRESRTIANDWVFELAKKTLGEKEWEIAKRCANFVRNIPRSILACSIQLAIFAAKVMLLNGCLIKGINLQNW